MKRKYYAQEILITQALMSNARMSRPFSKSEANRRSNLNRLIKAFGGQDQVGEKISCSQPQVSMWSIGKRRMSEASARHIEVACGLAEGSLDLDAELQFLGKVQTKEEDGVYRIDLGESLLPIKDAERQLLQAYRSFNRHHQEELLRYCRYLEHQAQDQRAEKAKKSAIIYEWVR